MIEVAEKSGFDGVAGEDFMKRRTCTSTSSATVVTSAAQNQGLIQRGSAWSNTYSANAIHTAANGISPARVWRSAADNGEVLGTPIKKPPAEMKVAITSASYDRPLAAGELTQLEWLDSCASMLGADGVVLERAHFPRCDAEYIAQLRKVAIDLGLVPLAVRDPRLLAPDAEASAGHPAVELAAGLGALFVLTELPAPGDVPPAAFVSAVHAAKVAIKTAKAHNVTLLAGVAAGTLGADVPSLRHFIKDVDSAWLRFALPAGADRSGLGTRDRVLVVTVASATDLDAVAELDESARPWFLLTGEMSPERVAALRHATAKKLLGSAAPAER